LVYGVIGLKHVVIIDDNLETCAWLADEVNRHSQFSVAATAANGREGVLLIEHHRPDLIILDIIMPDDDGLKVIKHIREKCEQYNPIIFVVTAVTSASMQKLLKDLQIDFIELKPLYQDTLNDKLNEIYFYEPKNNTPHSLKKTMGVNDLVEDVLNELDIPMRLTGYRYIKVALFYMLDNPNIKIDVYSAICTICNCTPSNADRNIRTAVEASMDSDLYQKLFGAKKASNLTFLHGLTSVVDKRLRGSEIY